MLHTPQAIPLGVLPDYKYLSTQISMTGACSIFMYSDGLIEARPEGGEPFGDQRLMETLAGRCCNPSQHVAADALQAVLDYSGGELRDDIAIVAVRFTMGPTKTHD
jgi:serine phosphatase RsbU (regulator of sigma subunit)